MAKNRPISNDLSVVSFINNDAVIESDQDVKGTRCLGSDEVVFEKRLYSFVIKCI